MAQYEKKLYGQKNGQTKDRILDEAEVLCSQLSFRQQAKPVLRGLSISLVAEGDAGPFQLQGKLSHRRSKFAHGSCAISGAGVSGWPVDRY
jgi:hypothetical protein